MTTTGPTTRGIGIIADPAQSLLLRAALEFAGIQTTTGQPHEVWADLRDGFVAEVVRLGAAQERDPGWVAAGRPWKDRVLWVESPLEQGGIDAITSKLHVPPPLDLAARWDSGTISVSSWALLGAMLQLRPTMKIVVERPHGWLGLCLAEGRVIAAAVEGKRFFDDPGIAGDMRLRLALNLWVEPSHDLDSRAALFADLGFLCEYDTLFSQSEAFEKHVAGVVGELLSAPCEHIAIEAHAPSRFGVPLARAALAAVALARDEVRRAVIGDLPLRALGAIPETLRAALPPAQYGRLFFALQDGATLAELPRGRMAPAEVESAVVLGLLAGAITRLTPPPASAPVAPIAPVAPVADAPLPELELTTPTPQPRSPTTGVRARVKSGTTPMGTPLPPPSLSLADPRCGSPLRFLEVLRTVADEGQRRQKRPRVTGTRFAPAGIDAGDALLYYGIGSGGHGSVYLGAVARGPRAGQLVAAKRLSDAHAQNPRMRAGFSREARLLETMRHPHIVAGHGELVTPAGNLMLMELVHGVSLAELITALTRSGRVVPEPIARYVARAVAEALAYVHELRDASGRALGLVHRDVAPANVLLGFDGRVKLADFSVTQSADDEVGPAKRGARSGRLGYMAPESLLQPPGPSADVFALACCLYEMLTCEPAIERQDPSALHEAIVLAKHVPILERAPALDPRLAYAIERGMACKPNERFANMRAFRQALEPRPGSEAGSDDLVKLLDDQFAALRARELEAIARMDWSSRGVA
ncbi:MAG: serine/threonine-protein kinase [Myxococcota bacterium]